MPPIDVGSKVRDSVHNKDGRIVDVARQYAHPQANPVYQYMIRWEDGQMTALSEGALRAEFGIQVDEAADDEQS